MYKNDRHPAEQLAETMTRIYQNGLTSTSGGNLSVMDEDGSMWITPGSIDKGTLTPEDIVRVLPDGTIEGRHKPSIEYKFHRKIYQVRPHIRAIVHAHPSALVGYSLVQRLPEVSLFPAAAEGIGKILPIGYAVPGSDDLVDCVTQAYAAGADAAIMANHGAITASSISLADAYNRFESLVRLAQIECWARTFGQVSCLTDEQKGRFAEVLSDHTANQQDCYGEQRGSEYCAVKTSSEETKGKTQLPMDLPERRELLYWTKRAAAQRLIAGNLFSFSRRTGEDSFLINPRGMGAFEMELTDLVHLQDRQTTQIQPAHTGMLQPQDRQTISCKAQMEETQDGQAQMEETQDGQAQAMQFTPRQVPEALWSIHQRIYRDHPEISAILLNYPEAMMGLACSDAELEPRSMPEIYMMLRTLPHLSLQAFLEDPDSLSRVLGKATPVTYVQNGFVISTADRLQTAFDRMEVAESAAQATAAARLFGEVAPLPEEEVRKIEEVFHLK